MNIHEYQAKELLNQFGVLIQQGAVAETPEEAVQIAQNLRGSLFVIKAQIHAGGRGKGGGVKLARSLEEVRVFASQILGMQLITPQTGPEGQKVSRILVLEAVDIEKEFYLSFLLDRHTSRLTLMASLEGGVEIEELAASAPHKIHKLTLDPLLGFQDFYARDLNNRLGLQGELAQQFAALIQKLYHLFTRLDVSMLEINPLVVTQEGTLLALDAKITFDDNALFRHPQIQALRDMSEEDPLEVRASDAGLQYIKLDGNIACMVNGAGLAMATMDVIHLHGGNPANFLDVGGGATKDQIVAALTILMSDPAVKGILINIFGGIMRCDIIAQGIVEAAQDVGLDRPLVVRLAGTHVEQGQQILKDSGLAMIPANDLNDAAQKIVAATNAYVGGGH